MSLFSSMNHTFEGVLNEDGQVQTIPFCSAARSLAGLVSKMGLAFQFVASDLTANVDKIEKYAQKVGGANALTIPALLQHESDAKQTTASEGLVWLTRGLIFLFGSLEKFVESNSIDYKDAVIDSYEETLEPHHPWFLKKSVRFAISGSYDRESFIEFLSDKSGNRTDTLNELVSWLNNYKTVILVLTAELGEAYSKNPALQKLIPKNDFSKVKTKPEAIVLAAGS